MNDRSNVISHAPVAPRENWSRLTFASEEIARRRVSQAAVNGVTAHLEGDPCRHCEEGLLR